MIATCARPSEALHTRWDEIDLDKKLWVLPPSKTKNAKTHVAPLPSVALEVLEQRREVRTGDWVFAGRGASPVGYSNFFRAPERGGGNRLRKPAFVEVDLARLGRRHRSRRSRPCRGGARPQSRQDEASHRRETAIEARRPVMDAYAKWLCGDAGADVIAFPSRA
jgi:integrase